MTFPGAGAQVYYNEAGEPIGWDYPSDEPPSPDEWYEREAEAEREHEYIIDEVYHRWHIEEDDDDFESRYDQVRKELRKRKREAADEWPY